MSLRVLYEPAGEAAPSIDFVAVHGLNFLGTVDHGTSTWEKDNKIWLRDFLPAALAVPVRVLLYEYNASPAIGAAAISLDDHAGKLLLLLNQKRRRDVATRPLAFIAHSLGGLLVKEALVEATLDDTYSSVLVATKLVVFFGTPHRGGNHATAGDFVAKSYKLIARNPNNNLVDALRESSNTATKRYEQFRHKLEDFQIISCFETLPYNKVAGIIVAKESATFGLPGRRELQIPIDANHSDMCKFPVAEGDCETVMIAIDQRLEMILTTSVDPRLQELLERLEFPNKRARLSQIRSTMKDDETFEWIWSSPFEAWLSEGSGIFWIRGKPASGKSALVNYITDGQRLEEHLSQNGNGFKINVTTHYFDFRQGSTLANNHKGMLLTILQSLLLQNLGLAETLRTAYQDSSDIYRGGEWDLDSLRGALGHTLSHIVEPVYIFLDGFDEFSGNNEEQLDLVRYLVTLSQKDHVRLCIASRPHAILQKVFVSVALLDMQDWNLPGLTSYIYNGFDKIGAIRQQVDSSRITYLSELIGVMAEGVFLWANFAVQDLIELWTQERLEFSSLLLKLAQLPHDVESLWSKRLELLEESERALGICLIQLVCSAARPLYVTELLHMARRQQTITDTQLEASMEGPKPASAIRHLSCGLLEVKEGFQSEDPQTVHIVHKSVRGYIDSKGVWVSSQISQVETIAHATFARERSLCYQGKTHDTSNLVCQTYGCYSTYAVDHFPIDLYEELHDGIGRELTYRHTRAKKTATFGNIIPKFWRRRKTTFLKPPSNTSISPLLVYAFHWLIYHGWILESRRHISVLSTINSLMCSELIIVMWRTRYHSCAFCTPAPFVLSESIKFHGSEHCLMAHSLLSAPDSLPALGPGYVLVRQLLHRRLYKAFITPFRVESNTTQLPSYDELIQAQQHTGAADDICFMDLQQGTARFAPESPNDGFLSGTPKRRKVAIVGSRNSGKSALTVMFVDGHYVESYYPTIENTFSKVIRHDKQNFETEIIDTAGQDEYSILNSKHFVGVHGYIIVYSVDSRQGFEMTRIIHDKILNHLAAEDVPCVIVGNRCEIEKSLRQVSTEEGAALSSELNCAFVEADPKYNKNVDTVFHSIIAEIEKTGASVPGDANACTVQ